MYKDFFIHVHMYIVSGYGRVMGDYRVGDDKKHVMGQQSSCNTNNRGAFDYVYQLSTSQLLCAFHLHLWRQIPILLSHKTYLWVPV